MNNDFIDYGQLIDEAMHIIVKKALQRVSVEGLPGKHHFFISFLTGHPGVSISEALIQKYPDEMTIVIQHQFEDLKINDKGFSVVLSFDNVKEKIAVPFDALVAFADPSVKFGLQFRHMDEYDEDEFAGAGDFSVPGEEEFLEDLLSEDDGTDNSKKAPKGKAAKKKGKTNVVSIDSFRKK